MTVFKRILLLVVSLYLSVGQAQNWKPGSYHYEYNAGPAAVAPKETVHEIKKYKEIIDLYAQQPENRYISEQLTPVQKFRYTFGAMMLRTNFAENSVKIFAIGQDAVDDAELVKLPGTGTGYSTRVQIMANFHGVDTSLATSNASFQTIKGQYSTFDYPYFEVKDGKQSLKRINFMDARHWAMLNGSTSPIVQHREKVWEWQLKNNPESLRLIILFGGAAHDAFAEFLLKRGFKVETDMTDEQTAQVKIPVAKLVNGGGNNEFPVLLTKDGKDLYEQLLKAKLKGRKLNYRDENDQLAAAKALEEAGDTAIKMMKFSTGGKNNNGIIHAAQMGGYDLKTVTKLVDGKWVPTKSLKGLRLSDGTVIEKDIAFVASPHPTSLSNNAVEAAKTVTRIFDSVRDLIGGKNAIEPDLDENGNLLVNKFVTPGEKFSYTRAFLPRRVVPFGAPDSILRPVESADRLGPQVLVSEPPKKQLKEEGLKLEQIFDLTKIEAAKKVLPIEPLNPKDTWNQHPRQAKNKYLADQGPGDEWARLMVESLDRKVLKKVKAPNLGFFAHYRGTFDNPRALIMYDSLDLEDRNTFRAATGARGQAVNGLMKNLGLETSQLVLTTVPVDMTDATTNELEVVRADTEEYRENMLAEILSSKSKVEVIFTDGPMAQYEVNRILAKLDKKIAVINIERGKTASAGILEIENEIRKLPQFRNVEVTGKPSAIPVQHLPWNSRDWERVTSGTVIEAKGKYKSTTYAIVTPNFVAEQKLVPMKETVKAVEATKAELKKAGISLTK